MLSAEGLDAAGRGGGELTRDGGGGGELPRGEGARGRGGDEGEADGGGETAREGDGSSTVSSSIAASSAIKGNGTAAPPPLTALLMRLESLADAATTPDSTAPLVAPLFESCDGGVSPPSVRLPRLLTTSMIRLLRRLSAGFSTTGRGGSFVREGLGLGGGCLLKPGALAGCATDDPPTPSL